VTGYSASLTFIDLAIIKECAEELQISQDISTLPSPKPTATEHDSPAEKSKIVDLPQKSEPDRQITIKKVVIIIAILSLFFGIGILFYGITLDDFLASIRAIYQYVNAKL
jgi:hypothetical protein